MNERRQQLCAAAISRGDEPHHGLFGASAVDLELREQSMRARQIRIQAQRRADGLFGTRQVRSESSG